MNDCQRAAERLTPYVDGSLTPAEHADVERHLQACPPCRVAAEGEQGARTVLRDCAARIRQPPLPPGLRSRCEALGRDHARVRAVASWRGRLVPATMIAVLVLVAGLAVLSMATRRSNALLAAQLTADHVKCFKVFVPDGGADAREVEAQLAARHGWDMHVPDSSNEAGVSLLGARRCLYTDGSVPHVMYRGSDDEAISLFRLEGVTRQADAITSLGHHSRIWSRHGHTYVLVGPASAAQDLTRIARYVQAEAR